MNLFAKTLGRMLAKVDNGLAWIGQLWCSHRWMMHRHKGGNQISWECIKCLKVTKGAQFNIK